MTGLVISMLVAIGGGMGALLRWAISLWVKPVALPFVANTSSAQTPAQAVLFPLPTFLANIFACALLGLTTWLVDANASGYAFIAVGFCGGLSTYSTFAVEVSALLRDRYRWVALLYLVSTLIGGLLVFLITAGWLRSFAMFITHYMYLD